MQQLARFRLTRRVAVAELLVYNWLTWQRCLTYRKINFIYFTYIHNSNIPLHFVKIGPVVVEITVTEIVKNKYAFSQNCPRFIFLNNSVKN